jgi:hypothetical protein
VRRLLAADDGVFRDAAFVALTPDVVVAMNLQLHSERKLATETPTP